MNKYLSLNEIEKQESLNVEKLSLLNKDKDNKLSFNLLERPVSSLSKVHEWAKESFHRALESNKLNIEVLINNSISMDGQFLQFCKEFDVQVETLHKDSILSWKTQSKHEAFFTQGSFKIVKDDLEFIYSSYFYKGYNNEDELCFFIMIASENIDKFLSFKNSFNDWTHARDRGNLTIKIIDGEDVPYERDTKWDDIILEDSIKKNLISTVEGFMANKAFYEEKKIPWKTGVILQGPVGCGKTSIVKSIMSNYDFKPVTYSSVPSDEVLHNTFAYAEQNGPSLIFLEDLDSYIENVNLALLLSLLDGVSSKNGLFVVATANNIERLPLSLRDRPMRFDKVVKIPLPTEKLCLDYLDKIYQCSLPKDKLEKFAKMAFTNKFSYSWLKELYISSMYKALAKNKKQATLKDVESCFKQIINDKNDTSEKIGLDRYI